MLWRIFGLLTENIQSASSWDNSDGCQLEYADFKNFSLAEAKGYFKVAISDIHVKM